MKLLFATTIASLLSLFAVAQPDKHAKALMNTPFIATEEVQVGFQNKTANALSIVVMADEGDYAKHVKNWLKNTYAIEGKKSSGFYSTVPMLVNAWSPDSMMVHYKTEKDGDGCRLLLILERNGIFYSRRDQPEVMAKVESDLKVEVKDFYIRYYDEKIADQQKYYDAQVSDLEKLRKKGDKLQDEIKDNEASVKSNNDKIRDTEGALNDSDGKIKSLNSTLQNNQKMREQAAKEVDDQQKLIEKREADYNQLNATGALNTRDGERVIKDLEKMRSKQEKLQSRLDDEREAVTKSENAVLKEEQNKTKLESRREDYKRDVSKHESKINDLKRDLDKNASDIKDEEKQVEEARKDLETLKAAKLGVTGVEAK